MSSGCGDVLSLQDLKTAKLHQTFEAEVITGKAGGVDTGAGIDYATNGVTGQVQKTLPAILRDLGYTPASFDFTTGGTLTVDDRNVAVLWPLSSGGDGDWYYWEGALPKVIPAASTPASTGGVADGAWRPVGDITLRGDFEDFVNDLASSGNPGLVVDTNVSVASAFSGGVDMTQHVRNQQMISVLEFGVVGDGVTDDGPALQAASAALATVGNFKGACLYIPYGKELYIGSNVSLAAGVSLSGQVRGAPSGAQSTTYNFLKAPCRLKVLSTATITLTGGNTISDLVAYRSTMTGAENNSSAYAGTLFTVTGDDVTVKYCMGVGFNYFYYSTGVGRGDVLFNKIDCLNPIYVYDCHDIGRIENNHMWPFGTINAASPVTAADSTHYLFRPGTAINLDTYDWPKVMNNFNYGHNYGLRVANCSNPQIVSNSFEGQVVSGTYLSVAGVLAEGTTSDLNLTATYAVHYQQGFYINLSDANSRFTANGCYARDIQSNGFAVVVGSGSINGFVGTGPGVTTGSGVRVTNTGSNLNKVAITNCILHAWQYGVQANGYLHTLVNNKFGTNGKNVYESSPRYTVASAATLAIIDGSNDYYVTGATTISAMTPTYHGHEIALLFVSAVTMSGGGTVNGSLKVSSGSLAVPSGGVVKFRFETSGGVSASSGFWRQLTTPIAGS